MKYIYSPYIIQCEQIKHEFDNVSPVRKVTDYEFDFCLNCNCEMWIDGRKYKIKKGDFVTRCPGQKVSFSGKYECYMLTLNFSEHCKDGDCFGNSFRKTQLNFSPDIQSVLPTVFCPIHYEDYLRIFQDLVFSKESHINENQRAIFHINELLHLVISDAYSYNCPTNGVLPTPADEVYQHIREHYREEIKLDDLADIVHLSKHYLVRLFRENFNTSPINMIIKLRMEYAQKLLAETNLSIKEIAASCGYKDPSFFNRYFKKNFTMTPDAYRQASINNGDESNG